MVVATDVCEYSLFALNTSVDWMHCMEHRQYSICDGHNTHSWTTWHTLDSRAQMWNSTTTTIANRNNKKSVCRAECMLITIERSIYTCFIIDVFILLCIVFRLARPYCSLILCYFLCFGRSTTFNTCVDHVSYVLASQWKWSHTPIHAQKTRSVICNARDVR